MSNMFFHIIDDQPFICHFISEVLSELGHETAIFTSSEKYVEYLKSSDYVIPSAIFSDITMPVVNGYQLMEEVLIRHPESQFVMMSGSGEISSQYNRDGSVFLSKPFRRKDIENAVCSVRYSYNGNALA